MSIEADVARLTAKHGAEHADVIRDALTWLAEREPSWGLAEPIDRDDYIGSILDRAASPVRPEPAFVGDEVAEMDPEDWDAVLAWRREKRA